ncbi:MAG: glycosyltransferase family 9 protein [Anaerolineae bacterium]|nr:glycosyltransferase family 9 protein [Anaerolineae bacterium]
MPDRSRARLALLRVAAGLASPGRATRTGELRLLVVRPDHLGDLVFLSPALTELRASLPEAHITLAVGPWGAGTAQLLPQVDRVETHPFPGFQRGPKPSAVAPYAQAARLAAHWTGRYDACLISRPDHWWGAMAASFAGIRSIVGWSTPETWPFLTEALPIVTGRHEVATNLALIRHFVAERGRAASSAPPTPGSPPLALQVPRADAEAAETWLNRVLGEGAGYVCVHPGAGAPTKLWPEGQFRGLIRELHDRTGLPILVTGSLEEADLVESTASASLGAIPTPGEFTVPQLAWVLSRARVCVGSDSGPLHLASALDGRTVHIYGPADEAKFGPWSPPERHQVLRADVSCRPCGDLQECHVDPPLACMTEVPVADVLEAALSLL